MLCEADSVIRSRDGAFGGAGRQRHAEWGALGQASAACSDKIATIKF